jgi:hypothetical protein
MSSTREPFAQIVGRRDAPLRLHSTAAEAEDDAPSPIIDPRAYQALRTSRRPPRLCIRCHTQPGHYLSYASMLDILFTPQFDGFFTLVFHHAVIHISGRNLAQLVAAIGDHRASVIEEYAAQLFDAPAEGAAIIERVEFEAGAVMERLVERLEAFDG